MLNPSPAPHGPENGPQRVSQRALVEASLMLSPNRADRADEARAPLNGVHASLTLMFLAVAEHKNRKAA